MSDTTFTNAVTLTDADWFNDLNRLHYTILGDPADAAGVKSVVGPTLGTEQATTSGTSIDFTSIPSWAKRITINLVGVSTNGTSDYLIQIGDSDGIETSGYLGASSFVSNTTVGCNAYTTGFGIYAGSATVVMHGRIVLELENAAGFMWTASGVLARSDGAAILKTAGRKATSAALDRVRLTTVNGTDAFDAGAVNITYE